MATSSTQQFGIRVGLDGGKAVEAGLEAIAQAGARAMASVERSGAGASTALDRVTRSANDNAGAVAKLGGSFSGLESQAKTVGRAVSDVSGALSALGGAGSQADKALNVVRTSIGGIADVAGTAAAAFSGASAGGLVGILTRFAGVVGIAITAYQAFNLITKAVTGSSEDAAKAQKDLAEAYTRLAQGAETAEERQARLREETLRGIDADLARVRSVEALNEAQARQSLEGAQARAANLQRQLLEEERVQAAAGERATAVQRARLEALRNEARTASEAVNAEIARIATAQGGVARAGAQAAAARTNALPQFGPPANLAGRPTSSAAAAREEAGALEASLNRLAAAAGQVRIPTEDLDEARKIIEATQTPAEKYADTLARLGELAASGAINTETYARAVQQAQASMDKADGTAKSLADAGRQLGLTFNSAFETAVTEIGRATSAMEAARKVAQGFLEDIARIIVRTAITNPLANAATSVLGKVGTAIGGYFGFGGSSTPTATPQVGTVYAAGGIFDRAGVVPFAAGGIVDRPTLFPFAQGTGLMGEAGPEAILPLMRTRGGALGVRAEGAAAAPQTTVIHIDARGADASVDAKIRALIPVIKAEVADAARRGGAYSRAVRGR